MANINIFQLAIDIFRISTLRRAVFDNKKPTIRIIIHSNIPLTCIIMQLSLK